MPDDNHSRDNFIDLFKRMGALEGGQQVSETKFGHLERDMAKFTEVIEKFDSTVTALNGSVISLQGQVAAEVDETKGRKAHNRGVWLAATGAIIAAIVGVVFGKLF